MRLKKIYIPASQWGIKASEVMNQINECGATAATAVTVNVKDQFGVGVKVDTFAIVVGAMTRDAMTWAVCLVLDNFENCEVVTVK